VVVFAATQLLGGGGSGGGSPTTSTPGVGRQAATGPAPDPASVTVRVLNGSGVPGLARRVSSKLTNAGYLKTNVTFGNAPAGVQSQATTVDYATAAKAAAEAVATRIGADPAGVKPLDPVVAAGSASGAQVVVTVGADLRQ
jgi:hypothetical protein